MSDPPTPALVPPDRREPRLFAELPGLASRVPWRPLAHLPTPVERCTAIASFLGAGDVWTKRDDLVSPVYGGNKVRRYEFLLADAEASGAKRLVTTGGIGSTQVMATALFGRALGLRVAAYLFDQAVTRFAKDAVRVDATAGAELTFAGNILFAIARTRFALRPEHGDYHVPMGASGPLPCLGYLDAVLELFEQVERGEMPRPDIIVVPAGSGGTAAALAVGCAYVGWPTRVIAARIVPFPACNTLTLRWRASALRKWLVARAPSFDREGGRTLRLGVFHGAAGPGYGAPTPEAIAAIPEVERLIGVPGEVTYSAKALVAVRALARAEENRGKTILFWQTLSSTRPAIDRGLDASLPRPLRERLAREPLA